MTLGLWILLAIAPSFGASFYLETPPVTEKAAATELARVAATAGPTRVVRRFLEGSGWQYVVVVEGFTDQKAAQTAAQGLAKSSGSSVDVFAAEGAEARRVSTEGAAATAPTARESVPGLPPTAAPLAVPDPVEPSVPASPEAAALFLRAIERVKPAADHLGSAPAIVFEFRRTVPGGPVVKHTYATRAADRYLDVVIEKGDGTSSRSGLAAGDAWLEQGATVTHEDAGRTREVLGRFAPDVVLATPFGLPALKDRSAEAVSTGSLQVDSVSTTGVRVAGATFAVDAAGNVLQATWQEGSTKIVQEFSDWRDAGGGVVVPHRIRTWREGVLSDDVQILRLDVKPKVDERWFRVPA